MSDRSSSSTGRAPLWLTTGLLGLAIVAPFLFYPVFLMKGLCLALFACAFNLLVGYVGLLSFGHAAFFGGAAYITAHTVKVWGWPPELGILAGVGVASALGTVFGYLTIRRQGIYFAMITLAFAQMIFFFCVQAKFTGGEDGIQAVPRGRLFGVLDLNNTLVMYYVVLAIFLFGFGLIVRTINSPFGQVMKAIRENEPRAISLGYRTEQYKLLAFILSAALAGLAGSTKTLVFQFASLTDVEWTMSGEVVLMTLIGGIGTVLGPVVGAFVIVTMENYLAQTGSWVTIIEGIIFVICVLTFREGIVGVIAPYVMGRAATTAAPPGSAIAPSSQETAPNKMPETVGGAP
jgi:branched-chain amino acid transport system permease protein